MKYRHKPTEVEAVQWTGLNLEEVAAFVRVNDGEGEPTIVQHNPSAHQVYIADEPPLSAGDWLVREEGRVFAFCAADVFDAQFEPVDEIDRTGDAATAGEPVADIALAPEEQGEVPVTCPHAWAEGSETITCELEPGHEGAHVGPGGSAPPA
jgi:hypothetical protein